MLPVVEDEGRKRKMKEERGRGFRSPKSVVEEDEAINNAVPASTRYKMKWAVEVFKEWQSSRGDEK